MTNALTITFDEATQSLGPLQEAAYRFLALGSCHITKVTAGFACSLEAKSGGGVEGDALRQQFLALLTDENLRAKINTDTAGVRNLIMALAFGALAREQTASIASE